MKPLFLFLIRSYQQFLAPFFAGQCRFFPTCSHYAAEAIEKKGAAQGLGLSAKRLLKCHPFHPGGVDILE